MPGRVRGALAAASVFARLLATPVRPLSTAERLLMLPLDGAPLDRPVSVRWNDYAVPCLRAETDGDLAVALGIVHRHLRQAQLEVLRRVAAGRLASMIGPLGLDLDRSVLALDLADTVGRIRDAMPDETRHWAESFVAGLNHHGARAAPAPELGPLGIARFAPWTLDDFLRLARLYSMDLTWPLLTRLLGLRDRTAAKTWRRDFRRLLRLPSDEAGAETVDGAAASPVGPAGAGAGGAGGLLARATRSGSNAAALSASRSRSGAPLLGGDPHLAVGLPNTWLLAGLASPTIDAVGLMLPGMPFVACGRNRDIAWGGTALHAASSDLVDLSAVPENGFVVETETIPVRFRRTPATIRRRRSSHGAVVSDGALFRARVPLALRWIGDRGSDEIGAMLGVLRARDRDGFRHALDGFAVPGQCMVYAGPDGIGRQVAAHLPKRPPGAPADLVVSPAEAARDWATIVTGDSLFSEWNPASGVVASANERLEGPAPDRVPLGWFFAADDRVSRLRALLADTTETFTLGVFAAVFLDERQPNALPLRDRLAAALPARIPPRRAAFADAVRHWDGGYGRTSRGALAFELLLTGTASALIPADALRTLAAVWATRVLVAERIERADPAALAAAVARALPDAARRFGRLGTWGEAHRHRLQHPAGSVPVLGRRFREAPFAGSGGNDTLNKTGHGPLRRRHVIRFGGTARYAFDLGDADASECVLFGGQDGWLGSANFADQVGLWRDGRTIGMPRRPERIAVLFPHETVLRPR